MYDGTTHGGMMAWHTLSRACAGYPAQQEQLPTPHLDPSLNPARLQPTVRAIARPTQAPTAQSAHHTRQCPHIAHQMAARPLRLLPRESRALEAHGTGPLGPLGAACAPLVDLIASSFSKASRTPASSSWRFSAWHRGLQVDLDHFEYSAP